MAKPKDSKENRAQMFGEALPELPATERLADVWRALGYARESMTRATPFDWQEVQAYDAMTGENLSHCEASCLVDMSRAYCVEVADTNPLRIAPMDREHD